MAVLGGAKLGSVELLGDGSDPAMDVEVAKRGGGRVTVIARSMSGFDVAADVPEADLALAPTRPVSPRRGIRLAPGAPVIVDGGVVTYDQAGVRVSGAIPADALGRVWTPVLSPDLEGKATVLHATDLRDAPGGEVVAALTPGPEAFTTRTTGRQADGYAEVEIAAPWLRATGWILSDEVDETVSLYGYGSGFGHGGGTWIELGVGAVVATSDGKAAFAKAVGKNLVRMVAVDGATAFVLVPTPWGEAVGRVVCAAEPSAQVPCAPR